MDSTKLNKSYDLVEDLGGSGQVFNGVEASGAMCRLCSKDGCLWVEQAVYNHNGVVHFNQGVSKGMVVASYAGVAYSNCGNSTGPLSEYLVSASKGLLGRLNSNRRGYIEIAYISRKAENKDFQFYSRENFDKPTEDFELQLLSNRLSAERFYTSTRGLLNIDDISVQDLAGGSVRRLWNKTRH